MTSLRRSRLVKPGMAVNMNKPGFIPAYSGTTNTPAGHSKTAQCRINHPLQWLSALSPAKGLVIDKKADNKAYDAQNYSAQYSPAKAVDIKALDCGRGYPEHKTVDYKGKKAQGHKVQGQGQHQ